MDNTLLQWTAGVGELHRVPLAGGDTSESLGRKNRTYSRRHCAGRLRSKGRSLRRSGASAGDVLYVTGQLGGAAAELAMMLRRHRRILKVDNNRRPSPSVSLSRAWTWASLCCAASWRLHVSISATASRPTSPTSAAPPACAPKSSRRRCRSIPSLANWDRRSALKAALHGGEDYELLFAAPASVSMPSSLAGVPITRIGSLKTRRSGRPLMTMLAPNGSRAELKPGGWEHFSSVSEESEEDGRADPATINRFGSEAGC